MRKPFAIAFLAVCAACNKDTGSPGHEGSSHTTSASPLGGGAVTTIKLGQTAPYSGPASGYGVIGKTDVAYFKMINDQGGINGRRRRPASC